MKIIMLSGSPRPKKSTSQYLLNYLFEKLHNHEVIMVSILQEKECVDQIKKHLQDADIMVVAFPLYVDGIPGKLLRVMKEIEMQALSTHCQLYIVVNNGFYEAKQNHIAIDMTWKWCEKCGIKKGYAIGVGAGEMAQVAPLGVGPSKNLGLAMTQLVSDIESFKKRDTQWVEPCFPRCLYKIVAHSGWRRSIKKNGHKVSEIRKK